MKFLKFDILLSTIFTLLIASTKCCIYSTNLVELGKILLANLGEIQFTDYRAIEDFKASIDFAIKSSIIVTPEIIGEVADLTRLHKDGKFILNSTGIIENYFKDVFSILTPYDNYNVQDLHTVLEKHKISYVMKNSLSLLRGLFEKQIKTRRIIKTLNTQPHEYHCKSTLSLHQKILGLHNRALLNLIMGFSTILYLSKHHNIDAQDIKMSPDEMRGYIISTYDQYTANAMQKLERSLEGVSRDIHRCDPPEHEHEKTYERLYDFVEYYLTSERFFNGTNVCDASPKHYDGLKHNSDIHKYIDESILCYGTLYQCDPVALKHLFLYGNDQIYRRYHAFSVANPKSSDDEIVYGSIGDATLSYTKEDLNGFGENSGNHSNLNENSTAANVMNCTIYGCYCDNHDSPRTVRYFSTKLVASAVKNDRVVTGLRLRVQDRVVYLQIQTGKLAGLGVVDPASVQWKEIQPVDINVEENSLDAEYIKLDYNKRSLYLDDIIAPKGLYLTGVKFSPVNDGVRIAAKFTPYEGLTLLTHRPSVISTSSGVGRTELKLDNSSIPLYMIDLKSKPMSMQGRDYIKFQSSGIENDAGQTTVPFLDIQTIETIPPAALGGFGLYLKGSPGFGGFITPKLISPKF